MTKDKLQEGELPSVLYHGTNEKFVVDWINRSGEYASMVYLTKDPINACGYAWSRSEEYSSELAILIVDTDKLTHKVYKQPRNDGGNWIAEGLNLECFYIMGASDINVLLDKYGKPNFDTLFGIEKLANELLGETSGVMKGMNESFVREYEMMQKEGARDERK